MTWADVLILFGVFPMSSLLVAYGTVKVLDFITSYFKKDKTHGN